MNKPVKKVELRNVLEYTPIKNAKGSSIIITLRNGRTLDIECFEREGSSGRICIFAKNSMFVVPHSGNVIEIGVLP